MGLTFATKSHIAELQVHLQAIIDIKEISHVSYAISRGIDTSLPEFNHPLARVSSWALPEEKESHMKADTIKAANHTINPNPPYPPRYTVADLFNLTHIIQKTDS